MRFTLIFALLVVFTMLNCLTARPALAESEGIGWIPTWRQAISEASKAGKPILLVAAAPQCAGVPGIW
jgi:hypothetical protein